MNIRLFLYLLLIVCAACKKGTDYTSITKVEEPSFSFSALPLQVNAPSDNALTQEKIALGKLLFFDPILSGNKDVACATCHHPSHGYAEFRDLSIGVNGIGLGAKRKFNSPNTIPIVKRNAHTILNTAFNGMIDSVTSNPKKAAMFWDNRVSSLEDQALEPIKALEEMRGTKISNVDILDTIIQRLKNNKRYVELFKNAFPNDSSITTSTLSKAIASFERNLTTPNTRFDQYLNGNLNALSSSEKEGFETFKRVGCAECHKGPMLSDYKLHVLAVPENEKLSFVDSALGDFKFRTPTLRNLRLTAPYMHNGTLNSLQEVLEFYEDIAGSKFKNPNISPEKTDTLIRRMTIKTKDIHPILSFLNSLNSDDFDKKKPQQVPSGLSVGGDI